MGCARRNVKRSLPNGIDKMKNTRIFAVHLLNDFSGSPLVFRQALTVLAENNEIHLFTATPTGYGLLNDINGVVNHPIFYKWHPNKLLTLAYFLWAQVAIFFKMVFIIKKDDTVYINTLLPFGAALAGFCRRSKVVYHVHEVNIRPALLKSFLVKIAGTCAGQFIFVSAFVKSRFNFSEEKTSVVYNALPDKFVNEALQYKRSNQSHFTVLMLCSLKAYKGIYQFVELAKRMPHIRFTLVLNTSEAEKDNFAKEVAVSSNCILYSVQRDTAQFYKNANLVVNLSLTDQWLETFGMTILEGMFYGLPAIVPKEGGVTELINDDIEGFQIDANDMGGLIAAVNKLYKDSNLYNRMSVMAGQKAMSFSQTNFRAKIKKQFDMETGPLADAVPMEMSSIKWNNLK